MCISVEHRRRTAAIASIVFAIMVTVWVLAVPVWNQPVFNWTQGKLVRFDDAAKHIKDKILRCFSSDTRGRD